jgi:uncharacterized DUF497 family protein
MKDIPNKLGIPDWEFRVVIGSTQVDYDPDKEESNRKKHGYSLESAVEQLEHLIFPVDQHCPYMVSDGYQEGGEVRHMHMGIDDTGKVVLFVTTMRPNETVRIISYRRASNEERKAFFQQTGFNEKQV